MKSVSPILLSAALAGLFFAPAAMAGTVVPTQHFTSIELEGGGHVVLRHGAAQSVTILKGSTQFTSIAADGSDPARLVIKACNNDCPHNYDLEIEIVSPDIKSVAIEGGGSIVSAGDFPAQHGIDAAISGGGLIDTRSMKAENAEASIEGGGLIMVRAEHNLAASIEGGGKVRYWGSPQVQSSIEGGGRVEQGS